MQQYLNIYRRELGLSEQRDVNIPADNFDEQVALMIEQQISIVSFTFGVPGEKYIKQLKKSGVFLVGTATHLEEAKLLENLGFDAIVAQGLEAGGHRGTFLGDAKHSFYKTKELVLQVKSQCKIPVIAAGGIMNGLEVKNALEYGAGAVHMGTIFLALEESGASNIYKQTILSKKREAKLTRVFSGKLAWGLVNRMMQELGQHEDLIPAYPVQHYLTQDLRKQAAQQNQPEFMSLWAGIGVEKARAGNVKMVLDDIKCYF